MKFSIDNFIKNTALETANVNLLTEKAQLLEKVKELEDKISNMEKTVTAFPGARQAWEAEVNAMKTEHATALETVKAEYEAKIATLTNDLDNEKVSVSNKVVAELASVGIQQGEVKEELSAPMTAKEAFNQFEAMKAGPARTAFYKQHEKLIVQGSHEK
jgi:chromosome segregation ATPase